MQKRLAIARGVKILDFSTFQIFQRPPPPASLRVKNKINKHGEAEIA